MKEEKIYFCPYCGKQTDDKAPFCYNCGYIFNREDYPDDKNYIGGKVEHTIIIDDEKEITENDGEKKEKSR